MPRSVENRQMIGLDSDSRKVIAALRRRNGKMTTNDAVNLAIRIAGTKLHVADVNESNELLHRIAETFTQFPELSEKLTSQSKKNEAVQIRMFAYIRRLLLALGEEKGQPFIENAENDFKQHMISQSRRENTNE